MLKPSTVILHGEMTLKDFFSFSTNIVLLSVYHGALKRFNIQIFFSHSRRRYYLQFKPSISRGIFSHDDFYIDISLVACNVLTALCF
jgi:hypothetical protein